VLLIDIEKNTHTFLFLGLKIRELLTNVASIIGHFLISIQFLFVGLQCFSQMLQQQKS